MKPLKNFIVVAQESQDTTTASGIILESKPKVKLRGTVLDVGPDVESINIGDTVYFKEIVYVGQSGDNSVFVINEETVFAKE